ncbi:sensor histidine kinase [Arthrobacter castelli]|uniref:sensor histidine kinase n=1 Tax=Arthrobacter castelli TaxID=271431 RepID=UPI00042316D0|nr:histidine kinase [Arthrobacter castelli]
MGVHQKIYRWIQQNPRKVDLLVMLLWLAVFALPTASQPVLMLVSAAMIIPIAFRRSHPVPATAVLVIVYLGVWLFQMEPVPALLSAPFMIHALAAYGPRWSGFAGLGAGTLGALLYAVRPGFVGAGSTSPQRMVPSDIPLTVTITMFIMIELIVVLAWTFGDLARTRRLRVQALEDRAYRLEIEQQQERDLAAADERSHIAREMHDIVAHSLSVIITQADGGRYASAADPAVAARTLETVADTGRTSLREMRRLLGVLRSGEETSTRPLPALADVDDLVATLRGTGLQVDCTQSGEPQRTLPTGAELTAYRVVQESLTNVLKHAGPQAKASVELRWNGRGLSIDVFDDGRGAAADRNRDGPGQGIRGMTERVKLYDGTLTAQPKTGGGFSVSAMIPYTGN